jgi:hypothetical protein
MFKLGGTSLGWRPADHQDFLRLATKYGPMKLTTLSFMNEVLGLVANITIDDIKSHVEVYRLS